MKQFNPNEVTIQTVNAHYVNTLIKAFGENSKPAAFDIYRFFLENTYFTDEQIDELIDKEIAASSFEVARDAHFLANVEKALRRIARIEPKMLADINKDVEKIYAEMFGKKLVNMKLYDSTRGALQRLAKIGKVEITVRDENSGWHLYKYIG